MLYAGGVNQPELKGVLMGAGFFAAFQAEAWSRIPGVRIAGVADLDLERARAFAARWGIPHIYGDAAEALAVERPDFIDIATGPEAHLPLTRMAAEAGVPVICQKPMAPSYAESVAMVEACEAAGVRLLMHENWRWQPWYREIRRLAEAGAFGRVFHLGFRMRTGDGRGPEPYQLQPYFRRMPRLLIAETLVHFLDTYRYLAGEIRSIWCRTARINPVILGEDSVLIEVEFENGSRGLVDANRISGPNPPPVAFGEFRVEGDEGMIRMTPEGCLWITRYGAAERAHDYDPPRIGYKGDSVKSVQEHLLECLRTGRPAESEGRAYLRTVAAMEACYRSAGTGERVNL